MTLVTQSRPDKSSYVVCIQNLPTNCSQEDVVNLLNGQLLALNLQQQAGLVM